MATLSYYTQTKTKAGRMVPLYARFSATGQRLVQRTPIYVSPEYWSQKKQQVRHVADRAATVLSADERKERSQAVVSNARETANSTNTLLAQLKAFVENRYQQSIPHLTSGQLPNEWLSEAIDAFLYPGKKKETPNTLFAYIQNFIDKAKVRASPKTGDPVSYKQTREYHRTFHYITQFCKDKRKGRPLNFEDITLDFYHDFVEYLQGLGLAKNTIGKKIQTLKIFLNAATDEGVNQARHFKSNRFQALKEESDHIHLSESEIQKIYDLNLSHKPKMEKARDLFVIGCWTGLRYSDWDQITPKNLEKDDGVYFLKVKQSKTGGDIVIPLHETVVSILIEKYKGQLPKIISNQKMNDNLKVIGKLAGIDDPFEKTITKAGMKVSQTYRKHELIGTHTARRSFATNQYNAGIPSLAIMQITGHKTESQFLKYIKVTPKEHARAMARIWRERPLAKIRKIS